MNVCMCMYVIIGLFLSKCIQIYCLYVCMCVYVSNTCIIVYSHGQCIFKSKL